MMKSWYTKDLGDGMMSSVPEGQIREAFLRLFESTGEPHDMAVFTRGESEGRLHCEVVAYFSPAAEQIAITFDARPCARPPRAGLGLLAGDEESWSVLFSGG